MRFRAPRSISPSPERSSSSDEEIKKSKYEDFSSDSELSSPPPVRSKAQKKKKEKKVVVESRLSKSSSVLEVSTVARKSLKPEQWFTDDIITAIRLTTRHVDPYEEWEKQIRKESFRTAQKQQRQVQTEFSTAQEVARAKNAERLAALHAQQLAEVEARLNALQLQQQRDEERLRAEWKARDKRLWENVERVIKVEEDKAKAKFEVERRTREEAEKKRMEDETRRRAEEERVRAEQQKKRQEEEEERKKREEIEKKQQEEERVRTERENADVTQRKLLGLTTATEEWRNARSTLVNLKTETIRPVKKTMRAQLGPLRRQITPKISQITSDPQVIQRVSNQLLDILNPPSRPHSTELYTTLLSYLAKAIILQAETEVTAEKRSAEPLARVTFNMLSALPYFPQVFFAKLVQRIGVWSIPFYLPSKDYDNRPWKDDDERRAMWGYRRSQTNSEEWESNSEHCLRISSILRVWFLVLKITPGQPLEKMFQLPRYWIWFSRLIREEILLERAVAAELIYTALDVLGEPAKAFWGLQWIKMLELIYHGVTTGMSNGKLIGGTTPEGQAARVRVRMEIEKIIKGTR